MSGVKRHEALLIADAPRLQAILPQGAVVCGESPVEVVLASDYDQLHAANQRLEGEVKRLASALNVIATCTPDDKARDVAMRALSTANGEVNP